MTAGGILPSGRKSLRRVPWAPVLLVVGLAVQLLPVLAFPTALTQDGPAHVDAAWVLVHHADPGPVGAVLREHYRIDLSPVPNMLSTFLLAGALRVLDPDVAERLLLGSLVVALVAALAFALRGIDRRAGWLAVAALPFAGSRLMAFGFYNFAAGVVGALVVLGLGLRRRAGWSVASTVVLALVLLLTWSAHLLPCLVAEGGLLLLALARTRDDVRRGGAARAALLRHVGPVLLASVPAGVASVRYLGSPAGTPSAPADWPTWSRVVDLGLGIRPFVLGSPAEVAPAVLTTAALVALVVATRRRAGRPGGSEPGREPERLALGLLTLAATVAYLLTPGRFGTAFGFLADRLAWFPALALVLWCAARSPGPRTRRAVFALLLVASVAAVAVRLPWQARISREAQEMLSVAADLRPGAAFVALRYERQLPGGSPLRPDAPDPLRHESSRLAMRAGGVDVGHYEGVTPYFQVTFAGGPEVRRRMDPRNGVERIPPRVDLPAARGLLDYVVVVGLNRASVPARDSADTAAVLRELSAHYRRVATSAPTGLVEVWAADPLSSPAPG